MGGICGIYHLNGAPVHTSDLEDMAHASHYRGKSGVYYWYDGNVGLSYLAMREPHASEHHRQPVRSEDGARCLVFDGRLDGRAELVRKLRLTSHDAASASDALLLLRAYERWEHALLEHIVGDFSFALWDSRESALFCARDSVGIRPFVYAFNDDSFYFASDIRQILAIPSIDRSIDGYALSHYLLLDHSDQARTFYAAVQNLLPGHALLLRPGRVPSTWRYWHPDRVAQIRYRTDEDYVSHFRELLFESVADRLRSVDGSVAIETSGGLDSSSLAAIAQHLYTSGRTQVQPVGYTIVFDELKECDERVYSLKLPQELGLELHQVNAEAFALYDDLEAYKPEIDTPLQLYESMAQHILNDARLQGSTAYWKGYGGDSLFDTARWHYYESVRSGRLWEAWPWMRESRALGYNWVRIFHTFLLRPLLPRLVRENIDRFRSKGCVDTGERLLHPEFVKASQQEKNTERAHVPRGWRSVVRQQQYGSIVNIGSQRDGVQLLNRRAAQYAQDAAFPLLDKRLAEFLMATPLDIQAKPGRANTRWIFREAMRGILPEGIRTRTTKGSFGPYLMALLTRQARDTIHALIARSKLVEYEVVHPSVGDAFERFCNAPTIMDAFFFWRLAQLENWLQTCHVPAFSLVYNVLQSWQTELGR